MAATIGCLNDEIGGEYIGELSTISITATGSLLDIVVVVTASEEVAEDELRYVDLLILVDLDGDSITIVANGDGVLLDINRDLEGVH